MSEAYTKLIEERCPRLMRYHWVEYEKYLEKQLIEARHKIAELEDLEEQQDQDAIVNAGVLHDKEEATV